MKKMYRKMLEGLRIIKFESEDGEWIRDVFCSLEGKVKILNISFHFKGFSVEFKDIESGEVDKVRYRIGNNSYIQRNRFPRVGFPKTISRDSLKWYFNISGFGKNELIPKHTLLIWSKEQK